MMNAESCNETSAKVILLNKKCSKISRTEMKTTNERI